MVTVSGATHLVRNVGVQPDISVYHVSQINIFIIMLVLQTNVQGLLFSLFLLKDYANPANLDAKYVQVLNFVTFALLAITSIKDGAIKLAQETCSLLFRDTICNFWEQFARVALAFTALSVKSAVLPHAKSAKLATTYGNQALRVYYRW